MITCEPDQDDVEAMDAALVTCTRCGGNCMIVTHTTIDYRDGGLNEHGYWCECYDTDHPGGEWVEAPLVDEYDAEDMADLDDPRSLASLDDAQATQLAAAQPETAGA